MKKFLFLFLLCSALIFAFSSCSEDSSPDDYDQIGGEICQDGEHDFSLWEVEVEATCKSEGYKKRTCQICNLYSERQKYTNFTNHKYNENFVCTLCGVATTPTKVAFLISDDSSYYILNSVNDKNAKTYTIPEIYQGLPVREIASNAFDGCVWLEEVIVPSSIKKIGEGAFAGCFSLKKMTLPFIGIDEEGTTNLFGVIFGAPENKKGLVGITQYKGNQETMEKSVEYWIPESLVDLTITGGPIYDGAFRNCSKIKRIDYTGTAESVGSYAFSGCVSLDVFNFPITISEFGDRSFQKCEQLDTLPLIEGIVKIGKYCFTACNFTYLDLPASLSIVGEGAFSDCSNLTNITIPAISSITNLPNRLFQDCSSVTTVTLKSGIKTIGRSCFSGCISLSSIEFSNTVEEIEKFAFDGCTSLVSVTLSPTVKVIESGAFQNCTSLSEISVGNSIETIESQAFEGCVSLLSISLPKSVSEIQENAFRNCNSLTQIVIDEQNESFSSVDGNIYNYSKTRLLFVAPGFNLDVMEIPEGVTDIDAGAFNNAKSIKKVVFPSTITEIKKETFRDNTSIISLHLTGDIHTIHEEAFAFCYALEEVVIENVFLIKENAFAQCPALKTVSVSNVGTIGKGAFIECTALKTLTISNVAEIGENAFAKCTALKTADLKENVKIIGKEAFSFCSSLETVMLGSLLEKLGEFAFSDCSSLKNVEFEEGIEKIDDAAFRRCTSLETIVLPFSVTHITAYAFEGCTSLVDIRVADNEAPPVYYTMDGHLVKIDATSGRLRYVLAVFAPGKIEETIYLPGVDEIGIFAFRNITGFKHVIVHEETKVIGREAFFNSSLETIDFNQVEEIGDYAFGHCMNLKEFIIPKTVKKLGSYAFQYCYNLDKLYLWSSLEEVGYAILHKNPEEHKDEYREQKTNIYVGFKKDEKPDGWDEFWNSASNSMVFYEYDFSKLEVTPEE